MFFFKRLQKQVSLLLLLGIAIGFLSRNSWLNSDLRLNFTHAGHRACITLALFFFLLLFSLVSLQKIVLTDRGNVEILVQSFLFSMLKEVFHCFSHFFILLIRSRDELQWKVIVGVFWYVAFNKGLTYKAVASMWGIKYFRRFLNDHLRDGQFLLCLKFCAKFTALGIKFYFWFRLITVCLGYVSYINVLWVRRIIGLLRSSRKEVTIINIFLLVLPYWTKT